LDILFSTILPEEDILGVIITGAGEKAFVAGADIKEFLELDEDGGRNLSSTGQGIFKKIELFPKPVVAIVNGFALGGGCELAMACHLRIASPNAKFGQPEVNLGLTPGYGGTQRLTQFVGKSKAMYMLLTGEMINAEQAKSYGLVNEVLDLAEAHTKAQSWIQTISSKGPLAVAKVIETVDAYFNGSFDGFETETENFGVTMGSAESREGIHAFIEKRKANFK
jgi:enoyl-CoA hydratase